MITTLLIVLGALLILFWLSVMILWWRQEHALEEQTLDRVAIKHIEKIIRLGRRTYYASALYGRRVAGASNKTLGKVLARMFPTASKAFKKHDALAGLTHGPSSYFLHTISSSKTEPEKPKRGRKKIVA